MHHENPAVISAGKRIKEGWQLCQALPASQNSPGGKGRRQKGSARKKYFLGCLPSAPPLLF